LHAAGATLLHCPTIEIVPPESFAALDNALQQLSASNCHYDWVLFTSKNAVTAVIERLAAQGQPATRLNQCQILAVGKATAQALQHSGVTVTLVPTEFNAEGAVAALHDYCGAQLATSRFLFPRAAAGREVLVTALQNRGATVDLVVAYDTQTPAALAQVLPAILQQIPDITVFTSPSTWWNFGESIDPTKLTEVLSNTAIACIGPVTAAAVVAAGFQPAIIPAQATAPALSAAIAQYWASR
jgi:uroporphyrinogen-III synthase